MKNYSFLISIAFLLNFNQAQSALPNAEALLKTSDRARGAAQDLSGLTWKANVTVIENEEKSEATYQIKVKKNDAIAEVLEPARRKKEITLFNDRNLWFLKPSLKKPVSISPRQKLMGQASNGDIASTQYARDYEGKAVGEEVKNGTPCWKLELKAKAKNVTYDKINYWISKKDTLGVYAEFLTVSGEIFKNASFVYGNSMEVGGKNYPFVSEMKIQDSINQKNQTTITYKEPKEVNLSESMFNVNNVMR